MCYRWLATRTCIQAAKLPLLLGEIGLAKWRPLSSSKKFYEKKKNFFFPLNISLLALILALKEVFFLFNSQRSFAVAVVVVVVVEQKQKMFNCLVYRC